MKKCLGREFVIRQIPFERQKPIHLVYTDVHLNGGYRIDLLVAGRVVVEIKAVDSLAPIHEAILLTYLRFRDRP